MFSPCDTALLEQCHTYRAALCYDVRLLKIPFEYVCESKTPRCGVSLFPSLFEGLLEGVPVRDDLSDRNLRELIFRQDLTSGANVERFADRLEQVASLW